MRYDYIIAGVGGAGLWLAVRMAQDNWFQDKKILLIDAQDKTQNDRTWCFWSEEEFPFVTKSYQQIAVSSKQYNLGSYRYHKVFSADFYQWAKDEIARASDRFTWKLEDIQDILETEQGCQVKTTENTYNSERVFSSINLPKRTYNLSTHPYLDQHFVGWFVKTKKEVFNPGIAHFMDFNIPQKGNTRFIYVLPDSETEALVEYTLFSDTLLEREAYEKGIRDYLTGLGLRDDDYEITETEEGVIPMTTYPFEQWSTNYVTRIGIAGGWAKPSTGYAFKNSMRYSLDLVEQLKRGEKRLSPNKKPMFSWMDEQLLDVLVRRNDLGKSLFERLFQRNSPTTILRFLDEQTTTFENLQIMSRMPIGRFMSSVLRTTFK
jgi:lycopene beta-cyclase